MADTPSLGELRSKTDHCTGGWGCPAEIHFHGCHLDEGSCDEPEAHRQQAPLMTDTQDRPTFVMALVDAIEEKTGHWLDYTDVIDAVDEAESAAGVRVVPDDRQDDETAALSPVDDTHAGRPDDADEMAREFTQVIVADLRRIADAADLDDDWRGEP